IRSQTSLNSVNNEDYSDQNLQENFLEKSQHVNSDFECNFSMASDMLSSELDTLNSTSDMDTLSSTSDSLKEIELQSKVRTESTQTIVDSGIDFQALPREYGPYFKNFTEMSFFTWVTKHMI
ncbi:3622_t:CDS:2, partial [Dentiscutata heterogama]